jgi:cis-L-3-hydroxyproline dehydratase
MKLAQIDVFQIDLPYSGGVYLLSGGREYRSFDATIVRIRTDTGIEGWGESTPFGSTYIASHARGVRAGIAEIAPNLLGLDPRRSDRINDTMDMALVGHEHAKTALDVACWDVESMCRVPAKVDPWSFAAGCKWSSKIPMPA